MGIYSRDYVRESSGRGGGWGDDIPAVKRLIIITVVVFIAQVVFTHPYVTPEGQAVREYRVSYLEDWFALDWDKVRIGQVWRLVTCAFLHNIRDPWHILMNMLGLWWFGSEMERLYGSKEFTLFYLAAAAASSVGFILWQIAAGDSGTAIGASGAVLAALTLYATHYPREKLYLFYGLFPVEVRWVVVFYAVMDLLPVLRSLQGETLYSGVGHAAHLIGIVFGFAYRHYDWRLAGWLDFSVLQSLPRRWRQSRTKRTIRVYDEEPPSATDIDTEVDRILAKITEQGSGSLTDREQAILTKASQQYKNRK